MIAEPDRPTPAAEAAATAPLLELASQRMAALQAALMEGAGIERTRLPLCAKPLIAAAVSAPPRVELGF